MCSRYRNSRGMQTCNAHYIREDVINSLVLDNLKKVISYAKDYESEFVKQVSNNISATQMKQQSILKGRLEQQTRRITEIDTIIQRLYEDLVNGSLTDERFAKMSRMYEKEQKELEISTVELRKTVEACEHQQANIKGFLKLVKRYTEPEQLTPEILHMLIEKIIVHIPEKADGHRIQQVDIFYNFVGQIAMSGEKAKISRRTAAQMAEYRYALSQQV